MMFRPPSILIDLASQMEPFDAQSRDVHLSSRRTVSVARGLPRGRALKVGSAWWLVLLLMMLGGFTGLTTPLHAQETEPSAAKSTPPEEPRQTIVEDLPAEPEAQPLPWILQPYRVRVIVSFDSSPLFPSTMQTVTAERLQTHLQAQFQRMWELTVATAIGSDWISEPQLRGLTVDELTPPEGIDKLFLATVSQQAGSYGVLVREWDASTKMLGSLHTGRTVDRREIVALLAENISEAFRPLAELEIADDQRIEFLVRGGEYLPRNPQMQQFQEGDFLVPYLLHMNRQREVQRIQDLPWTYLKVDSVNRSRIGLSVTSAFGNPITVKRRRVQMLAMRIRPYLPETEILIYPRGEKQNPLVGFRCEIMDRFPTEDDKVEDRLKLETDRRGIVTVPVVESSPLQYLYVYSGQALLARVPFIPGYVPRLEVEVPDDRARLNVEGEVALLQSELIDIVATREVLMARAKGAAKAKNWDAVSTFLKQLQDLPTLEQFRSRIDSLQVVAVQAAILKRDRVAEMRVKKLCGDIHESAQKHLDPFRIAEFRREMDEQRRNNP